MGYTRYLKTCVEHANYKAELITQMTEQQYRNLSLRGGIRKLWLRMVTYVLYPMQLAVRALCAPRHAVFIVTSNTFYVPGIAYLFSRFSGAKIINLVYDLYPDALEVAGKIQPDSWVSRFVGVISRFNRRKSDRTVYLGEFLKAHADTRWQEKKTAHAIDISAAVDPDYVNDPYQSGKIRIHYGGQLGYMHDAENLSSCVHACHQANDLKENFEFNFLVSGAQADYLATELRDVPAKIGPPVPSQQWQQVVRQQHIGLATLKPGGATVCLPSKIYAMMAAGLPIIAICPMWSDLASVILENNAGWVISNSPYRTHEELLGEDYLLRCKQTLTQEEVTGSFVKLLREIATNPQTILDKRKCALHAMNTVYGLETLSERWRAVIEG
ncbi:MAG: hypothetical protein H6756_12345 [Candidatus Omnitrophica bacterium]|nr:hypothetical protein [Candidatus Omnitrophota bacterium]